MKRFRLKPFSLCFIRSNMKGNLVFGILILCSLSCSKKVSERKTAAADQDRAATRIVGSDRDSHDCIPSAGYTWSVVQNQCVRLFESGIRLESVDDLSVSAFILFDTGENRAELFSGMLKSSIILERKSEGQPWTNAGWELVRDRNLVLRKDGQILFKSL